MTTKWILPEATKEREKGIAKLDKEQKVLHNFSRPIVEFLYNRGARTLDDIENIIDVSFERERNPLSLNDIGKASNIIEEHLDKGSKIIVMGDYDADGVASTSIMVRALRNAGGNVDYFVNDRFKHGFGINKQAVIDMMKQVGTPDLIITVDNGIVGYEGVQHALDHGVEVIITDHHLAEEKLPNASAVVNPHRLDDKTKFKDICGAAVAYKVMLVLYGNLGLNYDYIYDMRDLVAMATVADIMPLIDENRWFVEAGLQLISKGTRPQFEVLRQARQGNKPWDVNADLFGFTIGPMMNAPGRLIGVPDLAIDFFLTDDEDEMMRLAKLLVEKNDERKEITSAQVALVESIVDPTESNVIIAYHPDFKQGIVGLIAGRLSEKYSKPAIVFADGPSGTIKGSARSIPAYPIKDALDRVSEYIVQHGGHDGAAGLTIELSKLEDFKMALDTDSSHLTADDMNPEVKVDTILRPSEISKDLVTQMQKLEPFGEGFRAPLFGMSTLPVKEVQYMTNGEHAKIVGQGGLNVLNFGGGDYVRSLGHIGIIQAVGSPSLNVWNGRTSVQFIVHGNCLIGK